VDAEADWMDRVLDTEDPSGRRFDALAPAHHPSQLRAIDVAGTDVELDLTDASAPVIQLRHGPEAGTATLPPVVLLATSGAQLVLKRAIDIVGSFVCLVLLLPLLLATALTVALTSRGPVLYVQERIGLGGRTFKMLKFRSMYANADEDRHELIHLNECEGPVFKLRDDPRITTVGRAIRKLSIDELPQLLNVLRGDMSLVGPRPPLPEEVVSYGPRERARLLVTPGITCIWQVKGRSDLDFDTWVDLDLEYIRTWSPWLDVKLLALTVPAVLSGRGAY
jgi:exopolysaccharide biosynthesis polyprenyl glycosylphosphotransferase